MADISKEMAVQLADASGLLNCEFDNFDDCILALVLAAYKLGRNAGLEEAKQACVATHSKRSKEGLKTGYNAIMQCSDAIESLKDNTP